MLALDIQHVRMKQHATDKAQAQLFNSINEVEVSFVAEQHQTHVLLEVDRKFRGDGFNSLTIPHQQANPTLLVNEIRRMLGL